LAAIITLSRPDGKYGEIQKKHIATTGNDSSPLIPILLKEPLKIMPAVI